VESSAVRRSGLATNAIVAVEGAHVNGDDGPGPNQVRSHGMSDELRIVATVGNEAEGEILRELLETAGIRSMVQPKSEGVRLGAAARRDIYVNSEDYERAHELITNPPQ